MRPRTLFYAGLIALVGAVMITSLAMRQSLYLSVMHDRNPLFVRLSDGSIRNGFTIRVANKKLDERRYVLEVEGLPEAKVDVVGGEIDQQGRPRRPSGRIRPWRPAFWSQTPPRQPKNSTDLRFMLTDLASGETAQHERSLQSSLRIDSCPPQRSQAGLRGSSPDAGSALSPRLLRHHLRHELR